MARKDDDVPVAVKRNVAFHSDGRCQYRGCPKKVVIVDPVSGVRTELGRYAHILPVADGGPRAKYKVQYPHVDLHSVANIILLCSDHHDLIDKLEVDKHPPALLFRMKDDKSNLVQEGITAELARQCAIEIEFDDYARQYEVSAVLDQFRQARSAGPKHGAAVFKDADSTRRSLLKNPFKKGGVGEVLLNTEYYFTRLFLTYKRQAWLDAYQHVARVLRLSVPEPLLFHVFSCSLILIRDEHLVFQAQEKLTLISQILSALDSKIDLDRERRAAFLLLVKSALLRWRARFERGPNQRSTNAEALRCGDKSFDLSGNPGCLLQKALINYSSGLAFQLHEAPKHEPLFKACFDIMESPELADFPSAIKYRPRLYRETYRFSESIQAFWAAESRYPTEFKRIAYVLGEAVSGEYSHDDKADTRNLSDAKSLLEQAIGQGFLLGQAGSLAGSDHQLAE